MNWTLVKRHFENSAILVDIYYDPMTRSGWEKLFDWLLTNANISAVNCYIPETDENLDFLPNDVARLIDADGFYCFVSLLISDITLVLRHYENSELECDVAPSEIVSEEKWLSLWGTLEEIKAITGAPRYFICPEGSREDVFLINRELVA